MATSSTRQGRRELKKKIALAIECIRGNYVRDENFFVHVTEIQDFIRSHVSGITNRAIGKAIREVFPGVKRNFSGSNGTRVQKYYGIKLNARSYVAEFSSTPMPPLLVIDDIVNRLQTPTYKERSTFKSRAHFLLPPCFHIKRESVKFTSNVVGRGGFGVVYDALVNDINVAAKEFFNETKRDSVEREAGILSLLSPHKNVVGLIGVSLEQTPFYVFTRKYNCGEDTHTIFSALRSVTLRRELDWRDISKQVGEGLLAVHYSGVIHNDLKDDNVLLQLDEGKYIPKIIDFGKSVIEDENAKIRRLSKQDKEKWRRNYHWIAPELIEGNECPSKLSDVYSFGYLLHCVQKKIGPLPKFNDVLKMCRQPSSKRCSLEYSLQCLK